MGIYGLMYSLIHSLSKGEIVLFLPLYQLYIGTFFPIKLLQSEPECDELHMDIHFVANG